MPHWFYRLNGTNQGPINEGDLKHIIDSGALPNTTPVWKEGMEDWSELGKIQFAVNARHVASPIAETTHAKTFSDQSSVDYRKPLHRSILLRWGVLGSLLVSVVVMSFAYFKSKQRTGLEQFTFATNDDTITITRYTGPGGAVTIPSSINGLLVTSIGAFAFNTPNLTEVTIPNSITSIESSAFNFCNNLTKVRIPNSVTSIGDCAFFGCSDLNSIIIPNSVTSIGSVAFYGCSSLTSITIPKNVTSIGEGVFSACASLPAITVDPNNPSYSSVGGVLFDKSLTTLLEYPAGKAGSYTIPASVITIDGAFNGCVLTKVTIPASVTSVGGLAFSGCSNLKGIYFIGDAPNLLSPILFDGVVETPATVYYLPETTGWGSTFAGLPTAVWTTNVGVAELLSQPTRREDAQNETAKPTNLITNQNDVPTTGIADFSIDKVRAMAEEGNAQAQCALGLAYATGNGVEKDLGAAVGWYRKAAEQGYAGAQFCLGHCYSEGDGLTMDTVEGADWYKKAAEQGDADAQFALSGCYLTGRGVTKDIGEGGRWLRKAGKQGNDDAILTLRMLGFLPQHGEILDAVPGETAALKSRGLSEDEAVDAEAIIHKHGFTVSKALDGLDEAYASGRIKKRVDLTNQKELESWMDLLEAASDIYSPSKSEAGKP